jgi:DNA-binding protein HU-beta
VPAKYVVSKKRGGFGVILKASNGKQLADLGTLKDRRAVTNAIAALAKNAPTTTVEGLEAPPARKTVTRKSAPSTAASTGKAAPKTAKRATPTKAARPTKAMPMKEVTKRAATRASTAKRAAKNAATPVAAVTT